jgi:hypothetical protein
MYAVLTRVRRERSIDGGRYGDGWFYAGQRSGCTALPSSQQRVAKQANQHRAALESWTKNDLHHYGVFSCIAERKTERERSMHGFEGNPPSSSFLFLFLSFPSPYSREDGFLSSLHSALFIIIISNDQHGKESKRRRQNRVRLFCLLRISIFSAWEGRHNNVINAAFPFFFVCSGGKTNDAWMNKGGLRAAYLLACPNAL